MAFGTSTFSGISAAVNDIFSSQATASGLRIKALGTDIDAESATTSAKSATLRAEGDTTEAQNYDLAGSLATQNAKYEEQSTALQQLAQERKNYQTAGGIRADVGGAGLAGSGSALDVMRDSAAQGALSTAILGAKGQIKEAGYNEQATSYANLASYARQGVSTENDVAASENEISKQYTDIAGQENKLADKTETNGKISAGIAAASAVASIFV